MTPIQLRAAYRLNRTLTRQTKEKQRDSLQHAATKED